MVCRAVNGARVLEVGTRLGISDFGKNASARANLAVLRRARRRTSRRSRFAEFRSSYHMQGDVKDEQQKAHEAADEVFKDLRNHSRTTFLQAGPETALIYGTDEVCRRCIVDRTSDIEGLGGAVGELCQS